ncbi:MAG: hypothetical protein E6R07_06365, partial [Nevskiaceae bacterium]
MKRVAFAVLLLANAQAWAIPEGPAYPSAEWTQREAANFAMVLQGPQEQVSNPAFEQRWQQQSAANIVDYTQRDLADPSWTLASSPLINALIASATAPAAAAQAVQDAVAQIQQNPASALTASLNTPLTPLCASWSGPCTGDPFRYPGTDRFYSDEAEVTPVVFYDDG